MNDFAYNRIETIWDNDLKGGTSVRAGGRTPFVAGADVGIALIIPAANGVAVAVI